MAMLRRRSHGGGGSTLAEVLVSATFLAVVASALLTSVAQSHGRTARAERRLAALCKVRSLVAGFRAQGETAALTTGTTNSNAAVAQVPQTVSVSTTISLVAGYTHLYSVSVSASWPEGTQTETVSTQTYVRAPNG